jgi:hypothetical protein
MQTSSEGSAKGAALKGPHELVSIDQTAEM